ncbi:hypothetical protein [Salinibius halmophilus]|uniref:hypothetical protein n=1 Tax=Salinibius halmophilus TaxID=1853216 RepID=UPI000E66BF2F|nr:hypothetical protein [Salinibius halmophilus]
MATREQMAERFIQIAEELEAAAAHYRTTAKHFNNADVPRAGAHALAGQGHVVNAQNQINAAAQQHALKCVPHAD